MAKNNFVKNLNKLNYEPIIHILSIVIVILFIVNIFFISSLSSSLKDKIKEAEETARPAVLQLTIINAPNCNNCFDIIKVVDNIKSGNVNITSEDKLDFRTAFPVVSELIRKYNIEKLPTVIVKGETNKSKLESGFKQTEDALIFTEQAAPYFDVESDTVKGFVSATIIKADKCDNCTNLNLLLDQIGSSGVVINKLESLNEKDAKELIKKYDLKTLPGLILSSDALEYPVIKQNWVSLGSEESDGNLVLRNVFPPYKNISTGDIEGLVSVTYLIDSSCKECYSIDGHKRILQGYGLTIINENTLDVKTPEGFAFAESNNISLVPTVVVSNDAKVYSGFYRVFIQISTEINNNLVFTAVQLMGIYKDLKTDRVIEPPQQGA